MKSGLLTIIVSLTALLSMPLSVSAQLDTAVSNALGAKLDEYMLIIGTEPAEVKCEETDFLISSCTDSLVRQFTALRLYSHFMESKLMGDESVAIHIFDKWFSDGKVKMKSESDFMGARIFAEFNRQSLIGKKAPELYLENDERLLERQAVHTFLLRQRLRHMQDGKHHVEKPAQRNGIPCKPVRHLHATVRREYGTVQDRIPGYQESAGKCGIPVGSHVGFGLPDEIRVIGRKLDVMALGRLMEIYCKPYEYGSRESSAFYDEVFASYGGHPGSDDVKGICDAIAGKTLGQKDTLRFKQMAGDLMYWLGASRGEGIKCGLEYLIDRYIAGEPAIWTTGEDSLKVLSYSEILGDLLAKAPAGERLPAVEVSGIMKIRGKERNKTVRLDRLRNATVVFHTEGCPVCEAELAAADSLSKADRREKFFLTDIDEVMNTDPDTAFLLFEKFDLTVMPYITETDRKGRVTRKYMSLIR